MTAPRGRETQMANQSRFEESRYAPDPQPSTWGDVLSWILLIAAVGLVGWWLE